LPADDVILLAAGEPVNLTDSPRSLTAPECVTLALRHSPLLQADLARLRAAMAEAAQTHLWPNPLLTVALRLPEAGGGAEWDLGLSGALTSLLNRPGRQRAADARVHAAAAIALETAFAESEATRIAYASAAVLEALVPLRSRQEQIALEILRRTRERRSAGEAGTREERGAENDAARVTAAAIRARVAARAARLELSARIGSPGGAADWSLTPVDLPGPPLAQEDWLRAATERNPAVERARWLALAEEEEAAIAGAVVREGLEAGALVEKEADWSAGPAISVPIPLFDDGSSRRHLAAAEATAAAHLLVAAQRSAQAEARANWEGFRAALNRLEDLRSLEIPPLVALLEAAKSAVLAGEASPADVLRAEDALLTARASTLLGELEAHLAFARLLRSAGGLPPTHQPAAQ
jgi:outer membrane protein TolC